VPEVGSVVGKNLSDTPWRWLEYIPNSAEIRAQISIFEYAHDTNAGPVWQSLVQRGSELVDSLLQQEQALGVRTRHFSVEFANNIEAV
jgi:hypothetical protein